MQFLKADDTATILIGPFVDETDGVTAITNVTLAGADSAEIMKHNGTVVVDISALTFTHKQDGWYTLALTASETDTEGRLTVFISDANLCLPVWKDFMVVPGHVFDGLFQVAGTDYLQVDAIQWASGATAGTDTAVATAPTNFADLSVTETTGRVDVASIEGSDATDQIGDAVWDEVITGAAHAGANSAGLYIRQLWQSIVTRVNQCGDAGGATTIDLDAGASAVDNYYKGMLIAIISGTGVGQARACTGYVGATKVATIGPAWATNPDGDSWFAVLNTGSSVVAAIDDIDLSATMKTSINTECDTALTDYDPPTKGEMDTAHATTDALVTTVDGVVDSILADTGTDGVVVAAASKSGYALSDAGVDALWDRASAVTLSFETLVTRIYQLLNNEMKVLDADGSAVLEPIGGGVDIATGSITDNDTTTTRAEWSWT